MTGKLARIETGRPLAVGEVIFETRAGVRRWAPSGVRCPLCADELQAASFGVSAADICHGRVLSVLGVMPDGSTHVLYDPAPPDLTALGCLSCCVVFWTPSPEPLTVNDKGAP